MDTPRSILDVTPQMAESMSRDALHAVADAEIEAEHKRLKEREKCGALLSFPEVSSWEGNRDILLMLLNIALPFLAPWFWFLKLKVAAIIQMVICAPLFIVALLSDDSSPYFFSCYLAGALCTFVVAAWFALCAIGDLIERARYGLHIRSEVSNVKGNPFRVLREEVPVGNFKERVFYESFLSWASVREARYDELLRVVEGSRVARGAKRLGQKLGSLFGRGSSKG